MAGFGVRFRTLSLGPWTGYSYSEKHMDAPPPNALAGRGGVRAAEAPSFRPRGWTSGLLGSWPLPRAKPHRWNLRVPPFLPRCPPQTLHTWGLAPVTAPAPAARPGTAAARPSARGVPAAAGGQVLRPVGVGGAGLSQHRHLPAPPPSESRPCACPSGTVTSMTATGSGTSVRGTGCCGARTAPPTR